MSKAVCRTPRILALSLVVLVTMTVRAGADSVTIDFNGSLSQVDSPLNSTFSVGEGFAGSFTLDSSVSPTLANSGIEQFPALTAFQFTIGSFSGSLSSATPVRLIELNHTNPGAGDQFEAVAFAALGLSAPNIGNLKLIQAESLLIDPTHSQFNVMPPTLPIPSPATFPGGRFVVLFEDPTQQGGFGLAGDFTSWALAPVPEPATAVLLATGLVFLSARGRRKGH